jgi:hypothetical protein
VSTGVLPPDRLSEELRRVADELRAYNRRDRDMELEAELRAIREEFKVATALRRGLLLITFRCGLWRTTVPGQFWAQKEADTYVISCVCGQTPEVTGWLVVTRCECGRGFLYDGDDIRVDKSPQVRYAAPAE